MAERDSTTDVCDSDFESDFVSSHVLKSFDVDIDQVTSIAFSNLEETPVALISTNNTTCRNLYCGKSGEKTSLLMHNINGYCNGSGRIESKEIICAERKGYYSCDLKGLFLTRVQNQYDFSIPIRGEPVRFLKDTYKYSLLVTGVCSIKHMTHLAACLVDSHSYALAKDSRRIVRIFYEQCFDYPSQHFSGTNGKCRDIEFDGQERLFTYPRRIALSSTEDFWVVNRTGEQSGNVTVVGMADGKLKFKYNRRVSNIPFDPKDVARNIKETMVIADFRNHAIHLVKDDGTFLQYIMTSVHGLSFPTTAVIDKYDRAWIGCDFGKVHIVRFNKGFE